MLTGVALALSEIPLDLIEQHGLMRFVHDRGGEREVQFLFRRAERLLPVLLDGRLALALWGNRRGECRRLPLSGWTWLSTVEAGGWAASGAEEVVVPATLGLDNGVWYRIRQGVRALACPDERGLLHAFPIVSPATHFYRVMTKSDWAPCLLGETI
jgi:hypothetical protein